MVSKPSQAPMMMIEDDQEEGELTFTCILCQEKLAFTRFDISLKQPSYCTYSMIIYKFTIVCVFSEKFHLLKPPREQPAAFELHLAAHHLITDNADYVLAGCLMNKKERNLVAEGGKYLKENRNKEFNSNSRSKCSKQEEMIDFNDYVSINLDEGIAPTEEVLSQENQKANMQFKCDQCDFNTVGLGSLSKHMKMTSHYPPSDPLMYLDPKWVQESKVQCNLCPKAFKSLVVLKQHIGRSHKSDCNAAGVKKFEQTDIEETKLIMKREKEGNNIPANLVSEDLQREIISRFSWSGYRISIILLPQELTKAGEVHVQPTAEHPAHAG